MPKFQFLMFAGWRSPVIYKNTNELESAFKIDFQDLNWVHVPPRDHDYIQKYFDHENRFYESQEKVSLRFKEKKNLNLKKVYRSRMQKMNYQSITK